MCKLFCIGGVATKPVIDIAVIESRLLGKGGEDSKYLREIKQEYLACRGKWAPLSH